VRSRIAATATITPAVIWWYGLLAKIESGLDPAIATGLRPAKHVDAEDLLTSIAKDLNPDGTLSIDQLNSLFGGHYLEVRSQLLDSRLFKEPWRVSATISDDHVALAWGLVILRFLQNADGEGVWALSPVLDDDREKCTAMLSIERPCRAIRHIR